MVSCTLSKLRDPVQGIIRAWCGEVHSAGWAMETKFNVFEIFQIAEKIEHNWAKFYLKAAELFEDPERREIFHRLANWKARHEKELAERRERFSEKTGQFGTFDPDNYVLSNPQVMAGLALFTKGPAISRSVAGREGKKEIFKDAIKRSKQAIVFYNGLKDFAKDPASKDMLEQLIKEETRHIRTLADELEKD